MIHRLLIGVVAVLAFAGAACGGDDVAISPGGYTIKVEMRDIAFSPSTLTVKAGETMRFAFENTGKLDHEAIIGDEQVQRKHEQDMANGGSEQSHGGATGHDEGMKALSVKPGNSGELTHTFEASEDGIVIGCHERGHYAAGMKIKVTVEG